MADSAEEQKQIDDAEKAVEQWKVKKLINTLEQARGSAAHSRTPAATTRGKRL